jgi:aminodeoxyfutalosine deaminase
MMYRKFRGDALFTGTEMLVGGEVLITDETGTVVSIVSASDAEDAEHCGGIICPGLVNVHCHLELSWMEGKIAKHTGMIDFLLSVMKGRQAPEDEIQRSIRKAEHQMLREGIVAVGDICNGTSTAAIKKEQNIYYHNFIEVMGFVGTSAGTRFNQALDVFHVFASDHQMPVVSNSIAPHAPYSVSETLFKKIVAFPGNRLLTIHNQEHPAENEFFLRGTGDFHRLFSEIGVDSTFHKGSGQTSVQTFMPWLLRNQTMILVHNTETNADDLQFVAGLGEQGITTWFCLCPNANLYINSKLPDIGLIAGNTEQIVLGTDSLASNTSLSIIAEIHTIHKAFPLIPVPTLLKWATLNGAKALDVDDQIGSFEEGKRPGVVLLKGLNEGEYQAKPEALRLL